MLGKYTRGIIFWFVLLVIAITNAALRELFYKPILTPYLGTWAHQVSAITAILFFFFAIYFFLKYQPEPYTIKEAAYVGLLWFTLTLLFESWMNFFIRNASIQEVLRTYYFWNGELWIFVLISLILSPLIVCKILMKNERGVV